MKRYLLLAATSCCIAMGQPHGRLADYGLILEDLPVAQKVHSRIALKSAEARTHLARIESAQSGVLAELKRRKVHVNGAGQVLVNAIFVSTTRETALALRGIPGVAHVVQLPVLKPDLDRAAGLVNAQTAWSAVGGASNAGAGIKIGIIDSGIDQNHPGFQDSSLTPPAGFPKCTDGHAEDCAFTNKKVIVARSYVRLTAAGFDYNPAGTVRPDDYSPADHVGHGTAIAMIAAGVQNTGPAGTIQGIASRAFLGNYKIMGSPGLNDFGRYPAFHQAMLDAVNDGMDIIVLSLSEGDPAFYAPLDSDQQACGGVCDLFAQAVESAVSSGVVVVTSAGNDGNVSGINRVPTLGTIHRPGTAPSAITVGATLNSHAFYQSVRVTGTGVPGGLQSIRALSSDGPKLVAPLSAPIRDVGGDGLACSPLSGGSLAGAIALVQRGGACTLSDKVNNAQAAGAVGMVLYQLSNVDTVTLTWNATDTGIPAMLIGFTDGTALKSYLASNANGRVTLDPALSAADVQPDSIWPASSRGPSIGDFPVNPTDKLVVKPELVAPGVGIYTATQKLDPGGQSYHPSGYTAVTGTSYAVPIVAGAVAILKQKNPGLTPAQLKSLVVNTASQQGLADESGAARMNSVGAGKLNMGDAVNAAAALTPDTIHFGLLSATTVSVSRTLTVWNIGNASATFNIAVNQRDADSNSNVTVSPASLTVAAGQSGSVTVRLAGSRPRAGSYEGFLTVSGAGPTLRVPYQYLVSDGIPADVFPLFNGGFVGGVGDTAWELDLRLVDQFGIPLTKQPVRFDLPAGTSFYQCNGTNCVDGATANYGNAAALVNLGPDPGVYPFTATAGGLRMSFTGYVYRYPAIQSNGIVNAASQQVGAGLAPGSYISIYGSNFATATQASPTLSLPVVLSTVSVSFEGGGLSLPGHIHFVSPGQVNVQIPWEFEGQTSVNMKVTFDYLPSSIYTLPLAAQSPGVFTVGNTPAVQDSNFNLITASNPAKRGQGIVIYANGLGPVDKRPVSGDPTPTTGLVSTVTKPVVSIGGVTVRPEDVIFAGLVPGIVGLYQINVVVPANAPTGSQPLVVSVNGVNSNSSNLQVQ